jgi:hypothetical protein
MSGPTAGVGRPARAPAEPESHCSPLTDLTPTDLTP